MVTLAPPSWTTARVRVYGLVELAGGGRGASDPECCRFAASVPPAAAASACCVLHLPHRPAASNCCLACLPRISHPNQGRPRAAASGPIPDLRPESWGLTRDLGFHLYVTVGKLLYLPALHLQRAPKVYMSPSPGILRPSPHSLFDPKSPGKPSSSRLPPCRAGGSSLVSSSAGPSGCTLSGKRVGHAWTASPEACFVHLSFLQSSTGRRCSVVS